MTARRCSVCGKSFEPEPSRPLPFCSERCCQTDLGRWLDEKYGLPYEREEDAEKPDDQPDGKGRHEAEDD